ncbi:MAG: hypothetical protein ACAH08_02340 [Methylophilus sp.]|uniref:hypothetical protein n=1 Tax=Methylophilus sp. TaxID=29541 RepID=UPI002B95EEB5|nr:hypothetical protein [Methylophilus sp.]HSH88316.1 hypothetical protein [Methylophilus sp.]
MRKLILMILVMGPMIGTTWAADKPVSKPANKPPVNNAVPPCDNSPNSKKPSCDMDSDSVNVPPKMPHENGVIVPPEVPAEGLPNREKDLPSPKEPMQPTSFENNLTN